MKIRGWSEPTFVILSMVGVLGCGGGKPPAAPSPAVAVPLASPACLAVTDQTEIAAAAADSSQVQFCVDVGTSEACFAVDLATGTYSSLEQAPSPQPAELDLPTARLETTATEVKVCTSSTKCQVLKPALPFDAAEKIAAAIDRTGKVALVINGIPASGYQVAEIWDVATAERNEVITYARDAGKDQHCSTPQVLDEVFYVNASSCTEPTATGLLYSEAGALIGRVGGADFGTYGTRAVQVKGSQWAFLEQGARSIAIHDVKTGQLIKSIDLSTLSSGSAASGQSRLVRGAAGTLIVISGAPNVGRLGRVNLESGEVTAIDPPSCPAVN